MKSIIHKQMLVLVVLLSLVGQAFATTSVCLMNMTPASSEAAKSSQSSMAEDINMASPCHKMMNTNSSVLMDCCEQSSDSDSSLANNDHCACPDGSSSLSLLLPFSAVKDSALVADGTISHFTSRFISQISSALFRPPIA